MLHYMGLQPPRKYPVPEKDKHSVSLQPSSPCATCVSRVWTPELFNTLRDAPVDSKISSYEYQVSSRDLRAAAVEDCKWCKSIADGVHGRIFLDEMYERCNEGDGSSSATTDNAELANADIDAIEENIDTQGDGWANASAFNEEAIDEDVTGGWDSWNNRDTLTIDCEFSVVLTFHRGEGGLFTFLNVQVEVANGSADRNALSDLGHGTGVSLRYYINTAGINPVPELFPVSTTLLSLGSESNMRKICDWVRICEVADAKSTSQTSSTRIPSRLIDLEADGKLRLVNTDDLEVTSVGATRGFVALSYVWGKDQSFVLLKENELEFKAQLLLKDLPQTIQDAVVVTRCIGIQYLWVDAICIMQDSDDDKAKELPKMRLIYQKAAYTIVAAVSNSAKEGFLHAKEEPHYLIEPITIPSPSRNDEQNYTELIISYPSYYKRWQDPINSRAWTFQELLLSQRAIIFLYNGVRCIDRTAIPEADGLVTGKDPQLPSLPWSGSLFNLNPKPEDVRRVWLAVRGEYSRRSLSYQGDKLVAISAVAEEIGRTYGGRYLAGLWEKDLVKDLQWRRADAGYNVQEDQTPNADQMKRNRRSDDYVAPSWSWASIQGEIEDYVWDQEDGDQVDDMRFEVVKCEVQHVIPGFVYGAVTSGTLVVRGKVHTFIWRPCEGLDPLEQGGKDGFLAVRIESGSEATVGEALIDALDSELQDGAEVDCIAMSVVERQGENVEGIVLLSNREESYRRVGFFKVHIKELFDDIEPMEIVIV